jgi:hypothetical protein
VATADIVLMDRLNTSRQLWMVGCRGNYGEIHKVFFEGNTFTFKNQNKPKNKTKQRTRKKKRKKKRKKSPKTYFFQVAHKSIYLFQQCCH